MKNAKSRLLGQEFVALQTVLNRARCNITSLDEPPAVNKSVLDTWHELHAPLKLPQDLINLYSICDGWTLEWQFVGPNKQKESPLHGTLHISSIAQLRPLVESASGLSEFAVTLPPGASAAFVLDGRSCLTCLVWRNNDTWEVWTMDFARKWFMVSESVTEYFRAMLSHCGIPHWQFRFAPCGLLSDTKYWLRVLCSSVMEDTVEPQCG